MEHGGVETDRESMEAHARRYVEDAHGLRLMALLDGLVREHDVKRVAEQLGVDARTLATCLRRRRLTDHVRVALESRLQAESDRLTHQVGELAERVDALAGEVDELRLGVGREMGSLREEQAGTVRGLEQRLAHVEAQRQGGPGTAGAADGETLSKSAASEPQGEPAGRRAQRRPHPRVVTIEAEHGEEDVYGDAEPLVVAWREARAADRAARDRLERAVAAERLMTLEVALMEGHGLTLAPERYPFDGIKMSSELRWRRLALSNARRERARALRRRWLRRALTLGFWWE